MSKLLETYENMEKEAAEKVIKTERAEVLAKYASIAEELISEQYEDDQYNEHDVIKVAEFLIESDLDTEDEVEKVAELEEMGKHMANGFVRQLQELEA